MSMATLQLFQNPYYYPHYGSISSYGAPKECTPVGLDLKTGTLRVTGDMDDFMSCNYLSLERDNQTIYAWIDNVRFRTADSFDVTYTVDPYRTYKNNIDLGVQYIERRPAPTNALDPLLGAEQDYPSVESYSFSFSNPTTRVLVAQVRPDTGEVLSSTPVQPTPYQFYLAEYSTANWTTNQAIADLMVALEGGAQTENLATIYSIPYMDLSGLPTEDLVLQTASGTVTVSGFKLMDNSGLMADRLTDETPIDLGINRGDLLRVQHTVQCVVPEAGIIQVPDELLMTDSLALRKDVDLFSGACNYMLVGKDADGRDDYYSQSIRGSSISSIPVLSDPMDTYISQNQNSLAVSLLGDVATVAGGIGAMATFKGLGGGIGAGMVAEGATSLVSQVAGIMDAGAQPSNPPAFLGTATAGAFNNRFWVVVTEAPVDNAADVHSHFGYQYGKVTNLSLPSNGYIKTQNCHVSSDGTVPRWALDEVNRLFDTGILVH